jgi:hypothetical protein
MNLAECYAILGIEKTYDEKLIKTAYRSLAKEFHPDVNQNADTTEQFRFVKEAYETLLLFLEFRKNHGSKIGQMIIDEENKQDAEIMERVEKARKKKQEARDRETALIHKIYKTYTHSWRIYFAAILLLIGIPLAILLAYDFKSQGDITMFKVASTTIVNKDKAYEDFYVQLSDGTSIPVTSDLFVNCKKGKPLLVERGHFFGEIKALYEIKGQQFIPYEPISFFNDAWLFLIVLLVLPLFSFLLMKPNFTFVFFFVHYNMFLQPLIIGYVLLGDARIVYLWKVLFH